MKTIQLGAFLIVLLFLQVFISCALTLTAQATSSPDVYVGIDIAYGSISETKALVDQVSSYTNLLVIGTSKITANLTRLNETCQYVYSKGMSFIILVPSMRSANRTGWFDYAKTSWGDCFLGWYAYDEPAGRQLDQNETRIQGTPSDFTDAARQFESTMGSELNVIKAFYPPSLNLKLFTSDYALYWFDYKAGYDTVFTEFGWNYSKQFNVALCRGAATVQNKDWGAIILWEYTHPPFIESGAELYKDMVLAYDNGAKYIVVFDSDDDYSEGILKQEHFQALQQFWEYARSNPRKSNPVGARVGFVLPDGYGYGFRGPEDKIWGLWEADDFSYNLSVSVSNLLDKYGSKLDVIYDDGLQPNSSNGYSKLIYWDDPSLVQNSSPTSSSSSSPAVTQTPTETDSPTITTTPIEKPSSPADYTIAIVAMAALAGVAVPVVALRKKQRCITFAQTGIGRDFTGTVVVVDGVSFDKYGTSFFWDQGSRHKFEFKSPLMVNGNKQYVLISTNGLPTHDGDSLKASMETTVTGNYKSVFRTSTRSYMQ
jgi:hypothetical protein